MEKVKWGVIGCGGIADRRTLPGMMLADNAELVAVMDVNIQVAQAAKEKYNAHYAFDKVQDVCALEEIDAIYIASPVSYHKEQAFMAAKAKKHILIEKPVALTSDEAIEIDSYCKEQGVKLGVGLMMRFHSYHQKMKEIITKGTIGEIVSARAQLTCWFPEMENNWRQNMKTSGGGAMMDMGIHCIDLIQYITGLKAVQVAGMTGNQIFHYGVEDAGSVIMKMDNGSICYVDSNFNIPDDAARCKMEFYGTKGSIMAEGTISQVEGGTVEVLAAEDTLDYNASQDRNATKPMEIKVEFGNMYTKEIEAFGNAIINNSPVPVTAEDAIFNQKIVEAVYKSQEKRVYEIF